MRKPPEIIWLCPKCKEEGNPFNPICGSNMCPRHNVEMKEIDINIQEYNIIRSISTDVSFLEAMIDLKQNNPIEYQLKMSQFRANLSQTQKQENNQIKCPTCSSTNIKRISGTAKVAGAVTFGLFSKTARSQFKCGNCSYKW